jgi:hypothetical protein
MGWSLLYFRPVERDSQVFFYFILSSLLKNFKKIMLKTCVDQKKLYTLALHFGPIFIFINQFLSL